MNVAAIRFFRARAVLQIETAFGEEITIYDGAGAPHVVPAALSGGAGAMALNPGGYYDEFTLTATIRTASLDEGFVPRPGQLVDARSRQLRIPENGVTTRSDNFHLVLVSRDAPASR